MLFRSEALKAMAVAARTFGVYGRGRHARDGYDLCGTTHCQRVDLTGVTFCDSSGITALLAARNHALAARATIALAAVPAHISRIFQMVGLDRVFPAHATAQEAEAAWTPPAAHP